MGLLNPTFIFRRSRSAIFLLTLATCTAVPGLVSARTTVRIGVDLNSPPLSSVAADGQIHGFTADLLAAMEAQSDLTFQIVPISWREQLRLFEIGHLDALANVHFLEDRAATMDFTIGHAHLYGLAYVPLGAKPVRSRADLAGKRIGVARESLSHAKAMLEGNWGGTLAVYPEMSAAVAALRSGDCDVFIGQAIWSASGEVAGLRTDFIEDLTFEFRIAVQKGQNALLLRLNDRLLELHRAGVIRDLYAKWIRPIDRQPLHWRDVRPYAIGAAVAMIGGAILLLRTQRRRIIRAERSAIARHLDEELSPGLDEAQRLTDELLATGSALYVRLRHLRHLLADAAATLAEQVWMMEPHVETWAQALARLEAQTRRYLAAAAADGSVTVQTTNGLTRKLAPAPIRHLLFRATRELIRLDVRGPTAAPLRVQVELLEASIRLTVIALGRNADPADAASLGRDLKPLQHELSGVAGELLLLQTAAGYTAQVELPFDA